MFGRISLQNLSFLPVPEPAVTDVPRIWTDTRRRQRSMLSLCQKRFFPTSVWVSAGSSSSSAVTINHLSLLSSAYLHQIHVCQTPSNSGLLSLRPSNFSHTYLGQTDLYPTCLCRTYPYQIYRYAKIAAIKLYFPKAVSIKLVPIKPISIKPISFTLTSFSLET